MNKLALFALFAILALTYSQEVPGSKCEEKDRQSKGSCKHKSEDEEKDVWCRW